MLRCVAAALTVLFATAAFAAGFKVSSVQLRAAGQTLYLNGNLELALTPKVEEAVAKGIPIELAIDVRLYRERALIWDEHIASWRLRRELRYHALSGQYLISGAGTEPLGRESATSLPEALAELGALDDVALPLAAPIDDVAEHHATVRVVLDIEALPPLLRPVAYTSRAWDLNSGWTSWKVQR
ncbi:MAG TPA: DUF4390 domain-containing protein [Burkholderiales bacterium]